PVPIQAAPTAPRDAEQPRVVIAPSGGPSRGAGARGGTSAGTEKPTFFGVPVQARSIVFVIDRSISMGLSGGLEAAKRELLASLEGLPAATRFQLVFYNHDVQALPTNDHDGMPANTDE